MPPETVGNITLISTTEYYSVSGFSAPISSLANACVGTNGKVVVFPLPERRQTGRHAETVQVTCDIKGGLYYLLCFKIVTGVKAHRPLIGKFYITRSAQVMSITVRIAHLFPIDRLATVFGNIKTIIEIQRPRHLEHLITIGIHRCLFHFLLGNAALIGTCLHIFPFLGRIFLIFLLIGILSAAQLLFPLFPRFVIKRIAKGRTYPWKIPKRP